MQCLLIDDDIDDQEIFLMTLEKINKNIICTTADSGVVALNLLKQATLIPDYIFIDMNMPKMNGTECLAAIRQLPHLKDCKIFMYSTTAENAVVRKIKELGAEDFIVKPASPTVLQEILSNILNSND
jgi:CheY-like chemotaxis protein